tara:strand:- start:822 stop:1079 length:258 start_codon:yes stop_codon:yes gene_type:complete
MKYFTASQVRTFLEEAGFRCALTVREWDEFSDGTVHLKDFSYHVQVGRGNYFICEGEGEGLYWIAEVNNLADLLIKLRGITESAA